MKLILYSLFPILYSAVARAAPYAPAPVTARAGTEIRGPLSMQFGGNLANPNAGAAADQAAQNPPANQGSPAAGPGGNASITNPPMAPGVPAPEAPAPVATYGVETCMSDVLACVEQSLPDGLKAMFNSDMRNSVVNGMNLCGAQIDHCLNDAARLDGGRAYYAKNDVWVDFNSRVIQPQYYTLVLQKTGLTPNQAENTCWLLDRNVYGGAFAAVSKEGGVTNEYSRAVGAYNGRTGDGKSGTLGSMVNNGGAVDAQRGHYARWDAQLGECMVRVAAYNKDELITNDWFGGIGDSKPAEVWKNAGSSFTCKKETFDFNLMNQTKTAALASGIAVAGAAGAGALIGAAAANSNINTELTPENCGNEEFRDRLQEALRESGLKGKVGSVANCKAYIDSIGGGQLTRKNLPAIAGSMDSTDYVEKFCGNINGDNIVNKKQNYDGLATLLKEKKQGEEFITNYEAYKAADAAAKDAAAACYAYVNSLESGVSSDYAALSDAMDKKAGMGKGMGALKGAAIGGGIAVGAGGLATAITAFVESNNISCRIGDGLDQIGFGKSGRVKTLKEYYVEWALRLPDTVMPQQTVTECNSWNTACNSISNINDCAMAVITYKPADSQRSTQIETACVVSGNTCVANSPIAVSHGACK